MNRIQVFIKTPKLKPILPLSADLQQSTRFAKICDIWWRKRHSSIEYHSNDDQNI
jgi:hypothetical protein